MAVDLKVRFSAQRGPQFSPVQTGKHKICESIFVEKIVARELSLILIAPIK